MDLVECKKTINKDPFFTNLFPNLFMKHLTFNLFLILLIYLISIICRFAIGKKASVTMNPINDHPYITPDPKFK